MTEPLAIALIGYGEVGHIFGRELTASGARVCAYDILFDQSSSRARMFADAEAAGVSPARSAAEAAQGADIVISAVTASVAGEVAGLAAAYLKPGQVFLDVNSASPGTKRTAAKVGGELQLVAHSPAVLEVFELLNVAAFFGDHLVIPTSAAS